MKKIISVLILSILLVGCSANTTSTTTTHKSNTNTSVASTHEGKNQATTTETAVNGNLKVHFIDVGQGDSQLIQTPTGENMLIDAGTNASTSSLLNYLKSQGVKKINYLILTHPHEDHIGGADAIINTFDIGQIYMPKVSTTTKTFNDVLTAIKNKGLSASQPAPGTNFKLGQSKCVALGPINSKSDDLNTYSIIIKLTYGNKKFLFTGDAQAINEEDIINKGYDVSADVLKVGHHGSLTSTSDVFLKAVSPVCAVISVGKGNDYGHPHKDILQKLNKTNIDIYRTDESGTIIITSDGNKINVDKKASAIKEQAPPESKSVYLDDNNNKPNSNISTPTGDKQTVTVYITKTGHKYHRSGCRYLSKSCIPIGFSDAKSEGFEPCSVCNPPQ